MDDKQPTTQAGLVPTTLPFRVVLTPHRSLSKRGFLILMLTLCGVSFIAGLAFLLIGAWPVMGFFGLSQDHVDLPEARVGRFIIGLHQHDIGVNPQGGLEIIFE